MIKKSLLLFSVFIGQYSMATSQVLPLQVLCGKKFFKLKISPESKKTFNEYIVNTQFNPQTFNFSGETLQKHNCSELHLKGFNFTNSKLINFNFKNTILTDTIFDNTTFEHIDFRETDLKSVYFKNCKFFKCNLEGVDLSQTGLEGCKFKKVRFDGAHLGAGIAFNENMPHLDFVKLYAACTENNELEKAKALNKLFGVFKLKLRNAKLRGLNLKDIDLGKADLGGAELQEVRLSDTVVLPDYESHDTLVELYAEFIENNQIKDAETLNTIFKNMHLDLNEVDISDLNLKGINLSYAQLVESDLTGINFTDAKFKYTIVVNCHIENVILSENIIIKLDNMSSFFYNWTNNSDNQQIYQNFIALWFPDFSKEELEDKDLKKLDLRNINLYNTDFEGFDFTSTNLKRSDFSYSNLKNVIFIDANLKESILAEANLRGAQLIGANLIGANLRSANLIDADLVGAQLKYRDLKQGRWNRAKLSDRLTINQNHIDYGLEGIINVLESRGVIVIRNESDEPSHKKRRIGSG